MPIQTIQDWENDRFAREAAEEIAALDAVEPVRSLVREEAHDRDLLALHGRVNAGLSVQLLLDRVTTQTFITIDIAGRTETFEVQPCDALEAFRHPYCYGASLPIR